MSRRPEAAHRIGVDVGGTKVHAVLVEIGADGVPRVLQSVRRPAEAHGPGVIGHITALVQELTARAAPGTVDAVGVGLAGFVGLDGIVRRAPNATGLEGVDVVDAIRRANGLPATIENDANCVAVAATALRSPSPLDLVAVTLGTGIGGGIVIGGRLVRGARGFAGEPGHMVVDPDGPPCPCGQRGCWERYASGSGLVALAHRAIDEGRAPDLANLADRLGDPLQGEQVSEAAAAGSPGAAAVMDEFGDWVALGVANLINLLDPEVVVISGGLAAEGELLLARVRRGLERFPAAASRGVAVEMAPGGPAAGAIGAAIVARGGA